eukprot:m.85203 g.85203  ORF g.85203 m.85203 type:complete len:409 (+) comp13001_c0_seq1:229-1455(+)
MTTLRVKLHKNKYNIMSVDETSEGPLGSKDKPDVGDSCQAILECTLCLRMLYHPVTISCGHTFCQTCIQTSLKHQTKCPICRRALPTMNYAASLAVNVTLENLIENLCPKEYSTRAAEDAEAASEQNSGVSSETAENATIGSDQATTLPIFILDPILPRQKMHLNIFEPRYLVMLERCLQGGRRFGMLGFRRIRHHGHAPILATCGTEVEIVETRDARGRNKLVEIVGKRIFRVEQRWHTEDRYMMANVSYIQTDGNTVHEYFQSDAMLALKDEWLRLVRAGGWERSMGQLDSVIESIGTMPSTSQPDELALWIGALINPIPGLEVAPEIRPMLLSSRSTDERVQVALNGLKQSIDYLGPSRLGKYLKYFGWELSEPSIRQIQVIIPLLLSLCAVLFRFFSTETMDVE